MEPVKILLVDDSELVRLIMKIVLSVDTQVGEVREAEDGESAIRTCEDFSPDLVLLDYWMPHMDGSQTAAHIRARHPNACIVAFSTVLDRKPEWADEFFAKDDTPDPGYLVALVQRNAAG